MPVPTHPPIPDAEPGPEKAVLYRLERLLRIGVDELAAIALAEVPDSAHQVEELVAHGCPVGTAANIVL
jgi:hypothetical protein